jgi:NADH-quinone oxidoreductase subunit N
VRFVGDAPYPGGEYYSLLLFSGVGMLFMASGNNLISIYVSLELMALASYILAGYFKGEVKSTEAALKYFVLGAFSSGVLLYGLSLVYGVSGKLGLPELAKLLAGTERSNLLMLGILLLLSGLLFKIAAVPFHVWTPDVYEGSPTPITAFFSVGPKVAAYAILARIFYVAFPKFHADWGLIVAIVLGGDDDLRQHRGAAPGERQAHAGVLVDRERRLRACSASSASTPSGACGGS